jgi:hypothetical protein
MKEFTKKEDYVTTGVESISAMEALAIMQDRNPPSSEKAMAKERVKQLKETEAGREALEKARKTLGLDVKANMMDGGMVRKKKKTAKKMMGGGKVYTMDDKRYAYGGKVSGRKAKYNG